MLVNCDLGESFGSWQMGHDAEIMALVDQANIACGFHAGDPDVMMQTLLRAKANHLSIGAHPSYPDKQGFGRRSMLLQFEEIKHLVLYQVAALDGMAQSVGMTLGYIKPHGALYNDMMRDFRVFQAVLSAAQSFYRPLALMVQSLPDNQTHLQAAQAVGVPLLFEVFADRRYTDNGLLTLRQSQGAVLSLNEVEEQVRLLVSEGRLLSENGVSLTLQADSICVHGDDALSLEKARCVSKITRHIGAQKAVE